MACRITPCFLFFGEINRKFSIKKIIIFFGFVKSFLVLEQSLSLAKLESLERQTRVWLSCQNLPRHGEFPESPPRSCFEGSLHSHEVKNPCWPEVLTQCVLLSQKFPQSHTIFVENFHYLVIRVFLLHPAGVQRVDFFDPLDAYVDLGDVQDLELLRVRKLIHVVGINS